MTIPVQYKFNRKRFGVQATLKKSLVFTHQ